VFLLASGETTRAPRDRPSVRGGIIGQQHDERCRASTWETNVGRE
jgi:hypothetical protein